jgi:hypothetical protein
MDDTNLVIPTTPTTLGGTRRAWRAPVRHCRRLLHTVLMRPH